MVMPTVVLVDDPTWPLDSPHPAPKVVRSHAFRLLFDQGVAIGDIARRYSLPYNRVYSAIYSAPKVERVKRRKPRPLQRYEATPPPYDPFDDEPEPEPEPESTDDPARPAPPRAPAGSLASRRARPKETYATKPRSREQLMKMPKAALIQLISAKSLTYGSPQHKLIESVLDERFPGWIDAV